MDLSTKRAAIRVRLDKAHDDLDTARDLLQASHWRGAVNRAYYTVFHTASATLLWLDVERVKHSAVQAAFNQFLVVQVGVADERLFFESHRSPQ